VAVRPERDGDHRGNPGDGEPGGCPQRIAPASCPRPLLWVVLVLWPAVPAAHFALQIHVNQTLGTADRSIVPSLLSEITRSEQRNR
jgi:hypothetical protein